MTTYTFDSIQEDMRKALGIYAIERGYVVVNQQMGLFDGLGEAIPIADLAPCDRPHMPHIEVVWTPVPLDQLTPTQIQVARSAMRDKSLSLLSLTHDGHGYFTTVAATGLSKGIPFIPRASGNAVRLVGPRTIHDLQPFLTIYELRQIVSRLSDSIFSTYGHDRLKLFDTVLLLLATKVYDEIANPNDLFLPQLVNRSTPDLREQFQEFCQQALKDMRCDSFGTQLYLDDETLQRCLEILAPYSLRLTIDIGTQAEVLATFYQDIVSSTFRGSLGAYFTPKPIADLASALSEPNVTDTILDMSCGSGTFLLSAYTRALIGTELGNGPQVFGADIQERMVLTTAINSFLHGIQTPHTLHTDGLRINLHEWHAANPAVPEEGFSLIVGNPPYAGFESGKYLPYGHSADTSKRRASARVNKIIPFIAKTVQLLRPSGRAVLLIPTSVLNGEATSFTELRRWLSTEVNVTGVVGIPRDAFAHTDSGVESALLLFTKKTDNDRPSKVFFKTVSNVGYDRRGQTLNGSELNTVVDLWLRAHDADNCWMPLDRLYQLDRWDPTWLEGHACGTTDFTEETHVRLTSLCSILKRRFTQRSIEMSKAYRYFEVGDADINTGTVTQIHAALGGELLGKGRVRVPVQEGDVLLPNHRDSLIAKTAAQAGRSAVLVTARESGCITSNRFTVLKPLIHPRLLVLVLNSKHVRQQLSLRARGSASFDIRDKVLDEVWVSRRVLDDVDWQKHALDAIEERECLQRQLDTADSLLGLLMEALDE